MIIPLPQLLRCTAFGVCLLGLLNPISAQESLQFTKVEIEPNGEVLLEMSAPRRQNYRIEVSADLVAWTPLATLLSASSDRHIDSTVLPLKSRFYRAIPLDEPDILTGDHMVTTEGEVVFHPVNHASFVMSWNEKMIYNDPVGGSGPYRGFPPADLILVSHTHGDHSNASTMNAVRGPDAVIIAPQAVFNTLPSSLRSITTVLGNGESADVAGVTVEAVPSYNSRHSKGSGNGYVVTIGEKRIYMSGDTEDVAEMRALPNIDVAFLCMNLPFTMNITQAASAVREFRPRIVYPYHYRNQDSTFADLEAFKEMVGSEGGTEVRLRDWY